jgi:peptidylprolyl isomerase
VPESSTATPSSSQSTSPEASPSASPTVEAATDPVRDTSFGVKVTGDFGDKPKLTIPAGEAPATLVTQVLSEGSGPAIAKGQLLVVNYLGQTWKPQDGKVNVFDNSYDRQAPTSFPIGEGKVIKGWDSTLVGQKTGSRVVMSIPPAEAYGATKDASNPLAGEALVFVVDVLGGVDKNATATGTPAAALPAGFPKIESAPGQIPKITSVAGVKPGTAPQSALLLKGSGEKIDPKKQLAIQVIQTDSATGKETQQTWGQGGPQMVAAEQVLSIAKVLQDGNVGSRVVAVAPGQGGSGSPGIVLVIDVIGQY